MRPAPFPLTQPAHETTFVLMSANLSNTPSARHADEETPSDAELNRQRIADLQEQERKAQEEGTFTRDPARSETTGLGVGYHNDNSRSSLQLDATAVRRRYPTSKEQRRRAVQRVCKTIDQGNDMAAMRAASVLVAMERADNYRVASHQQRASSVPQVNVTVQVAAREAAVFGDLAAFKAAAEHQAKQAIEHDKPPIDVTPLP